MKKYLAVCIAALLVMLLAVAVGLAEDFEPEEPKDYTVLPKQTEKFEEAKEIQAGVFFQGEGKYNYNFIFIPKETGIYTIYLRGITGGEARLALTNKFGEKIDNEHDFSESHVPLLKN